MTHDVPNEPQDDKLRTIEARIDRLRKRIKAELNDPKLRGVLLGVLDLLEDEL